MCIFECLCPAELTCTIEPLQSALYMASRSVGWGFAGQESRVEPSSHRPYVEPRPSE